MKYSYARTGIDDQTPALQLAALKCDRCSHIYEGGAAPGREKSAWDSAKAFSVNALRPLARARGSEMNFPSRDHEGVGLRLLRKCVSCRWVFPRARLRVSA
jgi:hypothetical protein